MTTETFIDVKLLARTLAAGASKDDLEMFVQQCQRTGLDPFARQICMVQRRSKSASGDWQQKSTIMITIDGARLMAARTGLYNGSDTEWCGDDGVWLDVWLKQTPPAAARTSVMRGGARFTGIALWREYGATANGPLWKSMGAHLLAKCSEMLALRKGFPAELSGLYSADEMAQADAPLPWAPASTASASGAAAVPSVGGAEALSETPTDTPADPETDTPAPAPAPAAAAVRRPLSRANSSLEARPIHAFSGERALHSDSGALKPVTDLVGLCDWAMQTFPLAYMHVEQVKQALRAKGIKSWSATTDVVALQDLLAHIATSAMA